MLAEGEERKGLAYGVLKQHLFLTPHCGEQFHEDLKVQLPTGTDCHVLFKVSLTVGNPSETQILCWRILRPALELLLALIPFIVPFPFAAATAFCPPTNTVGGHSRSLYVAKPKMATVRDFFYPAWCQSPLPSVQPTKPFPEVGAVLKLSRLLTPCVARRDCDSPACSIHRCGPDFHNSNLI